MKKTTMEIPQTEENTSPYEVYYINGRSFQCKKDVLIENVPPIVKDLRKECVERHRKGNKQDKELVAHY